MAGLKIGQDLIKCVNRGVCRIVSQCAALVSTIAQRLKPSSKIRMLLAAACYGGTVRASNKSGITS
jgi:hypothetical protein